ncbi:MAG: hypothetical protein M3142_05400 [Bacteroidota bacterium]|nr:hypothetical protein [Bacteroidota bacterium]
MAVERLLAFRCGGAAWRNRVSQGERSNSRISSPVLRGGARRAEGSNEARRPGGKLVTVQTASAP